MSDQEKWDRELELALIDNIVFDISTPDGEKALILLVERLLDL